MNKDVKKLHEAHATHVKEFVQDGVLKVDVGGDIRVADRERCAKVGHPWSAEQAKAREAYVDESIRQYKEARQRMTAEAKAEEQVEMRATFGPGVTVVDVFTGEKVTL